MDIYVGLLNVKVTLFIPEHLGIVPGACAKALLSWLDTKAIIVHLGRECVSFPALLLVALATKACIRKTHSIDKHGRRPLAW